jgi:glyoxylase-like metal-dependent hydrolase (beta-lactamase superfamily II)
MRRRRFLSVLAGATAFRAEGSEPRTNRPAVQAWKGRPDSEVKRWDVITVGNLSRNRYWGEGDARGVRSAICTCTVVQGKGFRLIVDPSLSAADQMASELDRRTGLKPRDITAVFVTHEHSDHWFGLVHFPEARWLAAPAVAAALNRTNKLNKPVEPTAVRLFAAVEVLPTPGHTQSHHSLRFDCDGLSVVIAGDAVPTRDFWRERRGYFNAVDFALSARTMDKLAALADVVVPGHDNYFLNLDPRS